MIIGVGKSHISAGLLLAEAITTDKPIQNPGFVRRVRTLMMTSQSVRPQQTQLYLSVRVDGRYFYYYDLCMSPKKKKKKKTVRLLATSVPGPMTGFPFGVNTYGFSLSPAGRVGACMYRDRRTYSLQSSRVIWKEGRKEGRREWYCCSGDCYKI